MSQFLNQDFLLDTSTARRLFHDVARDLPIVDYHNHLPPAEIAADRQWDNLGEMWLAHDHYKWRVMRWAGIEESRVTGAAGWREKFDAFAEAMPRAVLNPVHHWSHLEIWRYFGLDGTALSPKTADKVWQVSKEQLAMQSCSAQNLLRRMKVELVGTTDDPIDDLRHHAALQTCDIKVVPTFRPDKSVQVEATGFADYIAQLEAITHPIQSFDDLVAALIQRLDHFISHGCRAADHGISLLDAAEIPGAHALDAALKTARARQPVTPEQAASHRAALFDALGRAYATRGLVMQCHMNVVRNGSSRLLTTLGPDAGGDSPRDTDMAGPLNLLLDRLDRDDALPRMVLYGLDPARNPILAATAGTFQDGSVPGKIQPGAAWWFNDTLEGMEAQMRTLAQVGLLSTFLGMLTDSRSFLSFPRHEYFRRLACGMIGRWAEMGYMPSDQDTLDHLIRGVCYQNARDWFLDT
ncbi:D-glucuronate isomerase [Epibacterium ulvae]|uniref:Uronate isomerase n=1 Tax=Epibacterium ulvae TaxID=1156985 RepID=A0A1G5R230_9RHOB|nr:glucuronate isomerase [Epibacterium ulvae]SCZ68123.1 D-glucuronate isomerase [Epibacterium ulvae]